MMWFMYGECFLQESVETLEHQCEKYLNFNRGNGKIAENLLDNATTELVVIANKPWNVSRHCFGINDVSRVPNVVMYKRNVRI